MSNSTVFERIEKFNQGRDRDLLKLKYQKMQANPFAFLRGSCHLFYEDLPADSPLNRVPLSWICGDLHLENFGSYQGDNRLAYFDINDFDESVLAPCTLDLTRLVTSLFLAVAEIRSFSADPLILAQSFLDAYTTTLSNGKARWIERAIATGLVKDLLEKASEGDRIKFLDKKAPIDRNTQERRLEIKQDKTRPVSTENRDKIKKALKQFADRQEHPEFFKAIDIAWRIAGTGSLGLERYIVLIAGKGSPNDNYLLDLKLANHPSILTYPHLNFPQPQWENESQRAIANQQIMQAIPPDLLNPLIIDEKPFVMREYQPSEDKIDLTSDVHNLTSLSELIDALGQVVAWSQLRSSGRKGSANADALIQFAQNKWWQKEVIEYAQKYSQKVTADYQQFRLFKP